MPLPTPDSPTRRIHAGLFCRLSYECHLAFRSVIHPDLPRVTKAPDAIPALYRDQKNVRAIQCSVRVHISVVLRQSRIPTPIDSLYGRNDKLMFIVSCYKIWDTTASNHVCWFNQPQFRLTVAARLSKYFLHIKIHLIFHDKIAGFAYLAG